MRIETASFLTTVLSHVSLVSLVATCSLGCAASVGAGDGRPDEDVTATSDAVVSGTKLAIAGVSASSNDGNVEANVLDGNGDTRWSAEGSAPWIRFDLGGAVDVNAIRIAFYRGKERRTRFDVQASVDGLAWKTLLEGARSSGRSTKLETFDVGSARARFVRIVGHGNTENAWTSLTEVEVYGRAPSSTPTDAGSPSTDAGSPPTDDGGSSPTDAGGPPPSPTDRAAPSDLLDLTSWKITLPIKAASGSGPMEVLNLKGYSIDPFFHLNAAKDGVVFQANVGGATTSNSGYPRSELREMTKGGALASWSTSSGRHTMSIVEAITARPVVKPHVVAGQIHDAEDDVVMVRLEGARLFIEAQGAEIGDLDAAYVLGAFFTMKLEAQGGHIRASYNGVQKVDYTKAATGCYFKAGVYTQSNPSKGDAASAYGEVVIRDLTVTHE